MDWTASSRSFIEKVWDTVSSAGEGKLALIAVYALTGDGLAIDRCALYGGRHPKSLGLFGKNQIADAAKVLGQEIESLRQNGSEAVVLLDAKAASALIEKE